MNLAAFAAVAAVTATGLILVGSGVIPLWPPDPDEEEGPRLMLWIVLTAMAAGLVVLAKLGVLPVPRDREEEP